jgi:hypothetical protein
MRPVDLVCATEYRTSLNFAGRPICQLPGKHMYKSFYAFLCAATWGLSTACVAAELSKAKMEINPDYLQSDAFKEALRRAQSPDAPKPDAKRMATCMAAVSNQEYCLVHWSNFVADLGSPATLKEQEALRRSLDESNRLLRETIVPALDEGQRWADMERANTRKRSADCIAAFGQEHFCNCLNDNVHFLVDFETYVRVVTSDAKPIPKPATEEERLINTIFRAREVCATGK